MKESILDAIVTDNFKTACELFLKTDLQEEDYTFLQDSIIAAITYFNSKRRDKDND